MTKRDRSKLAEVRNPVLAIPGVRVAISGLSIEARSALDLMLRSIALDSRERAQKCWRTHKAPMALYWKCVAVYSKHLARALRK